MKTIKILFAIVIAFISIQTVNAQSDKSERAAGLKSETIKVSGLCGMDKRRIETAAYAVDGVKSAVWDEYTQVLTLKYNVSKKDVADNAQKKIAAAGNDTQKYRADDTTYQNLPACCHYPRRQY